MNERQRAGGLRIRQPPQRRSRLAAPEGPGGDRRHGRWPSSPTSSVGSRGSPGWRLRRPFHAATLQALRQVGLPVSPDTVSVTGIEAVLERSAWLEAAPPRPRLRHRRGGHQARRPRPPRSGRLDVQGPALGAWRASSLPRSSTTRLLAIEVSIGRTGRATPYAVLEPVVVGGLDGHLGHAAQRGPGGAEGRPAGRVGHRPQGRRRDPRGGRPRRRSWSSSRRRGTSRPRCPACDGPLVRLEGESDTYCIEPRLPRPARPAPVALRQPLGDGHRGTGREGGRAPHGGRARRATSPTSTSWAPPTSRSSRGWERSPPPTCARPSSRRRSSR